MNDSFVSKGYGIVSIVNEKNRLLGIITDGDIRRQIETGSDIYSTNVEDIMIKEPVVIEIGSFAVEALSMLKNKNITSMPIVKDGIVMGTIRMHDILNAGIV